MDFIDAIDEAATVQLDYIDKDGVRSQRAIQPYAYERCRNGSTIVRAWDLNRRTFRTFRAAYIMSMEEV